MDLSTANVADTYGLSTGPAQSMGLSAPASFSSNLNAAPDFSGGVTATQTTTPGAGGFNANNILGFLGKNPGLLLAGAPLALDLLNGNSLPSSGVALQGQAAEAGSQAQTLSAYQQSGTLPSSMPDIVNQNTNASIAAI